MILKRCAFVRRLSFTLSAIGLVLAAGCGDWFGKPSGSSLTSSKRTGRVYALKTGTGEIAWEIRTGFLDIGISTVGDSVLVPEGLSDGTVRVRALDSRTGQERWLTKIAGAAWISSLSVSAENVYVRTSASADSQQLHVLDATSGLTQWRFPTDATASPSDVLGDPITDTEALYIGSLNRGEVSAFDAPSGKLRWKFKVARLDDPMMLVGKTLVLVSGQRVYGLDTGRGSARWSTQLREAIVGPLSAVTEDTAYLTARRRLRVDRNEMVLRAIDISSGQERWNVERPLISTGQDFTATEKGLFLFANDGRDERDYLLALDPQQGKELWRYKGLSGGSSPAVPGGDFLFFSDFEGGNKPSLTRLRALEQASGDQVWATEIEGLPTASPTIGSAVFVGTSESTSRKANSGFIFAASTDDGRLLWKVRTAKSIIHPPLVAGDLLLVATSDLR